MRRFRLTAAWLLAASVLSGAASGAPSALSHAHRQWLEKDAAYLIGPKETDVFLSLATDRQRDLFIEAFWKQRDPSPDTEKNEFREEHYRRMAYANTQFGRGGILPGWKTDRGRIHIILGQPRQDLTYDRQAEVVPVQIWFYQGLSRYGLPDAFSCVFFKPDPASDFVLYSPVGDGPAKLLRTGGVDPADTLTAYSRLKQAEPEVAQVALSLISGEEGGAQSPSLASQTLLENIRQVPLRAVEPDYALRFQKYKDIVEVEYSTRSIDCRAAVFVLPEPSGVSFVHYAIEPSRLSVEEAGDRLETVLETVGRVTDGQGRTVFQFERKTPVSLGRDQADSLRSRLISVQGLFPLAAGVYGLTLILKNTASKEFTTVEERLTVPAQSPALRAAPLLLAYASANETPRAEMRAFRLGGSQFYVSPLVEFRARDSVWAATRLSGSEEELGRARSVRFEILDEEGGLRSVKTVTLPRPSVSDPVACAFELESLPAGDYRVRASVLDPNGKTLLEQSARFGLTSVSYVPRPLVFTDPMPEAGSAVHAYLLGGQYFNLGDLGRAESLSREAWRREPASSRYALGYARVLLAQARFQETRDVIEPFVAGGTGEASSLEFMAEACRGLGDYPRAVQAYEEYLTRFGVKVSVLNGLGESSLRMGDKARALAVFEKSLEIAPDQDEIRRAAASLRK